MISLYKSQKGRFFRVKVGFMGCLKLKGFFEGLTRLLGFRVQGLTRVYGFFHGLTRLWRFRAASNWGFPKIGDLSIVP